MIKYKISNHVYQRLLDDILNYKYYVVGFP